MKCLLISIALIINISSTSLRHPENEQVKTEKYIYQAMPAGSRNESDKRDIEMEFVHSETHCRFSMKSISKKEKENINIDLNLEGEFISGSRRVEDSSGKLKSLSSIWREQQSVFMKRESGRSLKTKEYQLPKDKPLAVDGSLLYLLRSFPFDQGIEWKVFMIDFTQGSVSIKVRQAGVQQIHVEAGSFECYRMEVIVRVLVFRPKIIYWISKKSPHFMVKHYGKISPLSRTYETNLVSINPH